MSLRVAITGASGFLGSQIAHWGVANGVNIVALGRRPPLLANPGIHFRYYDLANNTIDLDSIYDCDAVIHCAYDLSVSTSTSDRNIHAALAMRNAAHATGAHFVFISSMSAHSGALSSYGCSKWRVEKELNLLTDTIIKPGLIVGSGGIYARIRTSLLRLPVVPLFYGGRQLIQPISLYDLVPAVWSTVLNARTGVWALGVPQPIQMDVFYRHILRAAGRNAAFLHLPGDISLLALRILERFRIHLPINSDNLLGLKCLKTFDVQQSISQLGIEISSLNEFPWV